MYERFTDRARKTLQLANQEAQRVNHEYVGTEHILIGLIKEGSGVAANVLNNLGISLAKVRERVEAIVQPGPDHVTMGKLPQTPRARRAIEFAIEEARDLNHNYIGTEHLLLGLLREDEGLAGRVLVEVGLELGVVRQEILCLMGQAVPKPQQKTQEIYAGVVERIKEICGDSVPAKEAFERIALVIKTFNESEPPDADQPLVIDLTEDQNQELN
jgi:ATP-dependent Clp protease ATP-binding subunit ClpA